MILSFFNLRRYDIKLSSLDFVVLRIRASNIVRNEVDYLGGID